MIFVNRPIASPVLDSLALWHLKYQHCEDSLLFTKVELESKDLCGFSQLAGPLIVAISLNKNVLLF